MIPKTYFKNGFSSSAIACFFSIFFVLTPLKSAEQLAEKSDNPEVTEVPWSIKAEQALKQHQDKFSYLDSYYQWSFTSTVFYLVVTTFVFSLLLFFCGKNILEDSPPGVQPSHRKKKIKLGILLFIALLSVFNFIIELYGRYSQKGSFFLTNTGILIIEPGYGKNDTWLYYQDIEDIQILSQPTRLQPTRILRIIMKGGKVKEYNSNQMISSHNFQSFYNRLVDLYTDWKAR